MNDLNSRRMAVIRWMNEQGIINPSEMDTKDFEAVRDMIGSSKGLGVILAILRFRREESMIFLRNAKLGTAQADCAASVLQGQIAALDSLRDLLLEIADPTPNAAGNEQEQTSNG